MSRPTRPAQMVGNEFVVTRPRLKVAAPVEAPAPSPMLPRVIPVMAAPSITTQLTPTFGSEPFPRLVQRQLGRAGDIVHKHSVIVFALLFLAIGSSGTQVAASYASAHIASTIAPVAAIPKSRSIAGLNITVPHTQLETTLQKATTQAAILNLDGQAIPISPESIRSWLQVTPSADRSSDYIRVKSETIAASIHALASKYAKAPVDQVSITHEGSTPTVVVAGSNGSQLNDPEGLDTQARTLAKTLMDGKGFQLTGSLAVLPFQNVTPAAFPKLIEVNVDTKQMYLYDSGTLTHTYPISAGAPATPTPIGQYKIYQKLAVQDMRGFNANGTKYFQPNVRWINYFLPGGYAVHGNYWRPQSWFGNINSSHGCVSLPDAQAKEVYDWAPLGTTVITHH